jgi:hypothetical protein
MELKVDIGFDKLMELINQLSDEEKKKLHAEVGKLIQAPGNQPDQGLRPFGVLKGKVWMADDFDEPLDDFKDYM